jgi:predicted Zn-dependent protease
MIIQEHRMRTAGATLAIMTLLLAGGCSSGGGFNIVSLEEEWQLGNQLAQDIARQMPLSNDQQALAYVNRVGRQIVSQTEMGQLPWNFHIVVDPEVNAFNIPGGHVYVTTGLIAAADDASEFAGVMAHEIAHGVERHGTEQLSRAYGLNIIAAVLLGQNPAVYQQILAQIVGTGTLARFGRDAENEADQLGVRMMHQAGYNPRGMVTMFQELLRRRQGSPGAVEKFFSTHPLTEDRIRYVERAIGSLPAKSNLVTNEAAYTSMRSRLGG